MLQGAGHGGVEGNPVAAELLLAIQEFRLPIEPLLRLIEDAAVIWASEVRAKGLSLSVMIDPGLAAPRSADSARLLQVIGNLMANAIKFTIRRERPSGSPGEHDVFGAGTVAYRALTGQRHVPDGLSEVTEVFDAIVYKPILPLRAHSPRVPEHVEAVVLRALAKPADERYPTAQAMRMALEEALAEHVARHG